MDYRRRKYFLVAVDSCCLHDIIRTIKCTIPSSKIHILKSHPDDTRHRYSKFMVSCKDEYSTVLEHTLQVLLVFMKNSLLNNVRCYYEYRRVNQILYKGLTKDLMGQ